MGLRINTNIAAINAHRNLGITDARLSRSMERLSSGYRINRARDDAAGLAQAQSLAAQTRSLAVAGRNTTQANALLSVAEGGADQIQNILLRLKELATQAASKNADSSLADIQNEASSLVTEISRIANATQYDDDTLLTGYGTKTVQSGVDAYAVDNLINADVGGAAAGSYVVTGTGAILYMWEVGDTATSDQVSVSSGAQTLNFDVFGIKFTTTSDFVVADNGVCVATAFGVATGIVVSGANATFQVGESNGNNFRISFSLDDLRDSALGTTGKTLDNLTLSSLTNAQSCLDWINVALDQVSSSRAEMGAIQNRLDYTYASIQTSIENVSAAESVIRDVDMAGEMVTFTKTQILLQAGTAMLAQANMAPQSVLQLLG